jgi:hypothetical protein
LVQETVNVASVAVEAAQKVGITAEAVQELGFAAGQSGSNQESLINGLGFLSKNADAAKTGSKEMAAAFRKAGVDTKALLDGTLPLDGALEQIADRFKNMEDGAAKQSLAKKLFGRAGVDLIPLLNAGADGIRAMRNEAQELGGVIDNETAAAMEDFGDQQDKVKFAFAGIRNEVVRALLPTLAKLTQNFLKWVKANREFIAQKAEKVVRGLVSAVVAFTKAVALAWEIGTKLYQHWKLVLILMGSMKVAFMLMGAASIKAALASAVSWAASILPIIALGVAIAAVVLIVQDLWSWFNGGESVFKNLYEAAEKWIGDKLSKVLKKAREAIDEFLNGPKKPEGVSVNAQFNDRQVATGRIGPMSAEDQKLAKNIRAQRRGAILRTLEREELGMSPTQRVFHRARAATLAEEAARRPIAGELNTEYLSRAAALNTKADIIRQSIRDININITTQASDPKAVAQEVRAAIADEARNIQNGGN